MLKCYKMLFLTWLKPVNSVFVRWCPYMNREKWGMYWLILNNTVTKSSCDRKKYLITLKSSVGWDWLPWIPLLKQVFMVPVTIHVTPVFVFFVTKSITKNGAISSIVPFVSRGPYGTRCRLDCHWTGYCWFSRSVLGKGSPFPRRSNSSCTGEGILLAHQLKMKEQCWISTPNSLNSIFIG